MDYIIINSIYLTGDCLRSCLAGTSRNQVARAWRGADGNAGAFSASGTGDGPPRMPSQAVARAPRGGVAGGAVGRERGG